MLVRWVTANTLITVGTKMELLEPGNRVETGTGELSVLFTFYPLT